MTKLISSIFSIKKNFLTFLITINFLIHFPFMNLPPCSIHVWRQCNTLAVARNFSEESMNILQPRVDRRNVTNGVTGMQFPAYEYVCACVYKITGEHFYVARIISLLLFSLSIWFIYELVIIIAASHWAGVFAAWSFCWCPELFYHSINALPDIMALACALNGLLCFLKWDRLQENKFYWCSLSLITLAGLIKLQYLMFGGIIAVIVLRNIFEKKYTPSKLVLIAALAIVSIGVTISWYMYALSLIESSNLRDFGIELRPAQSSEQALKILKDNLLSDLPELLLNYAGTVLFILGIVSFFIHKKWKHWFFIPLLLLSLIYIAYHFIELGQVDVHHYYMLPGVLVLVIIMSYGAKYLWDKKLTALLVLIMFAQPVLACIRILPARWIRKDKAVPVELFDEQMRIKLIKAVPDDALCLAGPDNSGCIYFYYLNKKGFGYESTDGLEKKTGNEETVYLKQCIQLGAKYIYTSDSSFFQNQTFQPILGKQIKQVGNFRVIELKR
ncbi:MAG: glycosyltransferase family 39 protein [Bacteroidia bacterium]